MLGLENIKTHHWAVRACSAVSGKNLLSGLDWLVADVASRLYSMD